MAEALVRDHRWPIPTDRGKTSAMARTLPVVIWVVAMAVMIIAVDIVFFRHHFWPRLAANIGIVLLVGAFYFRFRADL
ncbi:hypothetical protein [Microlunatus endophyticus]|uniref:hypothetical protein n=1 Tax=Microlunatus endophyticus TaxID=1716077 RepID=UPI00166D827B|nr:hypothetical protein [Microlunatus endophyticus]